MNHIYIIKTFESGRLLVAIDYAKFYVITPDQYQRINTRINESK